MGKKHKMKFKERPGLNLINTTYIDRMFSKSTPDKRFSRLFNTIPKLRLAQLWRIATDDTIGDCNVKARLIREVMVPLGFTEIGCGTNRIAFRKNNYVYKIALDKRGFIDDISEYKRTPEVPQRLFKGYETNRVVIVGEYVELVSKAYWIAHRAEAKAILSELSTKFIMDDVGLTEKNYCNWGLRATPDGEGQLVLLDCAYLYPIRKFDMIRCECGGKIVHSEDFTYYQCSNSKCGKHYIVAELLNMANYDYDAEDEEAIKMMLGDGKETYVKVSGMNSGTTTEIDDAEAKRLIESYKDANSFDASTVNIVEDVEDYWLNNTSNNNDEDNYKPLELV